MYFFTGTPVHWLFSLSPAGAPSAGAAPVHAVPAAVVIALLAAALWAGCPVVPASPGTALRNLRTARENLDSYVEQEKLLNRIWEQLMTKLDDQDVFTEILKTIVGHMGAYTSYIYRSDFTVGQDIVYAHFQAGDEPVVPLEEYPRMPINPDAEWFKMTMNREIWEVTDTETEEARRIQGEWNCHMPALKIRALCGIGLRLNGEFWGYMGFSFQTPQKPLSVRQKFLLSSMAHITEIFLERKRNPAVAGPQRERKAPDSRYDEYPDHAVRPRHEADPLQQRCAESRRNPGGGGVRPRLSQSLLRRGVPFAGVSGSAHPRRPRRPHP